MSSLPTTSALKNRLMSETRHVLAALAVIGLAGAVFALPAHADIPPAAAPKKAQDPQVAKFAAAAAQAMKQNNLSLAVIQLKNALRLDPNNGQLRFMLGTVLLRGADPTSAEREFRTARLNGASDNDVVPPLLQIMIGAKKVKDVLAEFPAPAPNDKSKLAATILRARALAYQASGDPTNALASIERALTIQRDLDGLLTRVQIAVLQSQPTDAMKYVDQALAMAPNNQSAMMMKATILRFSDKNAALAMIDSVIKANPNALSAVASKIELLVEMGRNDEAQKAVNYLLSKAPNAPIAIFYNALLMGTRGQAKEGWRIAQSLSSDFIQSDARTAIGAATLASQAGNVESAHSIMSAFVTRNPGLPEPRVRLAALRLRMNNPKGALEAMTPLMNSSDGRALEVIATAYEQLGQHDNAMQFLRKADTAGSTSPTIKYQLAMDDLRRGNTAKGVQAIIDGINKTPANLTGAGLAIEWLVNQKKFAEAQTIANQAEKLNPKSPMPAYFMAQILYAQKKMPESLAAANLSIQRDPRYMLAYLGRAQIFIDQKKNAEATADLKKAEALDPKNPIPTVKLAEIAATTKQTAQAIDLIKKAIAKAPKHVPTYILLARYQVEMNRSADAEKTLKDALAVSPNDPQVLALLGSVQQRMGQKSAALGTNKLLVEKYQQSGAAQFLLANSLTANGDKKGALEAMKRATELSPDVMQYRTTLINLQIEAGDAEGAIATARGWETLHKGLDATIMLAQTYAKLKRYSEAMDVIQKNKAGNTDWRLPLLESQIATARGDTKGALAVLKDWLAGHSTDLSIRQAYADTLMQTDDNAAALAQYEIILKTRNDVTEVLNNAAWLLRDSDPKRATALASRAYEMAPNSPDIADTFGWLLLKSGNAKGAVPVLQKAHAIGPDNGEISYHLALALNATGKKAEARSALQAALAKNSNFKSAAEARKLLQTLPK